MSVRSLALVGATGGAGTTRTAVELAAILARDGRDVAVLDAAYATQGLAEYASGRIEPDLTALVTDDPDAPLSAATHEIEPALPGTIALVPARAPFERLARAKTAEAARAFEDRIADAVDVYDHVLVDVPPIAANQAVAAVSATERTAAVLPATRHGRDALQRLRGRLTDLDESLDATLATRGDVPPADVGLPETEPTIASAPVAGTGEDAFAEATAAAAEAMLDVELGIDFEEGGVLDRLREAAE